MTPINQISINSEFYRSEQYKFLSDNGKKVIESIAKAVKPYSRILSFRTKPVSLPAYSCPMSYEQLKELTGIKSNSSIQSALIELTAAGLITYDTSRCKSIVVLDKSLIATAENQIFDSKGARQGAQQGAQADIPYREATVRVRVRERARTREEEAMACKEGILREPVAMPPKSPFVMLTNNVGIDQHQIDRLKAKFGEEEFNFRVQALSEYKEWAMKKKQGGWIERNIDWELVERDDRINTKVEIWKARQRALKASAEEKKLDSAEKHKLGVPAILYEQCPPVAKQDDKTPDKAYSVIGNNITSAQSSPMPLEASPLNDQVSGNMDIAPKVEDCSNSKSEALKAFSSHIPETYKNTSRNSYRKVATKEVMQDIDNWIDKPRSIILRGQNGNGKTGLAITLAKEAIAKKNPEGPWTPPFMGKYCNCAELGNELLAYMADSFGKPHLHKIQVLKEVDLLVLDDYGKEPQDKRLKSQLYEIINERAINHKLTIVTTNKDFSCKDHLDEATHSRMKQWLLWEFKGTDMRVYNEKLRRKYDPPIRV